MHPPGRGVMVAVLMAMALTPTAHAQGPAGSVGPRPNVGPADRPVIVPAAAERGRRLWAAECVTCHGASARGTDRAPSLVRSLMVLRDRQGRDVGPFLRKGHPLQSGRPSASLTDTEIADVMQFVRQRVNDTLRGSPVFEPGNILTGQPAAGAAYFAGEGGCTACHSPAGDFAHLGAKYSNPVDLQQRMLFPVASRFGPRSGGPNRTAITAVVATRAGTPLRGTLIDEDDFFVTLRDAGGVARTIRRGPGVTVTIDDPLQAHHAWLDRVTDANIHDLVAYLVTLK